MAKIINGKDNAGNHAYISVSKENGKILVFSSEDCSNVVLTKKQSKELIEAIENCIKE